MRNEMKRMIVFGAYSAIATAVARLLAKGGTEFLLVGRDAAALERLAADLKVRGAPAAVPLAWDLAKTETHAELFARVRREFADYDSAFLAYGTLPDQSAVEADPVAAVRSLGVNFTSAASLLLHLANHFEARRSGVVGVITSVAGDVGRRSNYVYGSAKGGLSKFLDGLRARLHAAGVAVVDVRPGFVDTPMTEHLKKGALFATPESIAPRIVRALRRGRAVAYAPGFWRGIMLVLRYLPWRVLYRLPI